MTDFLGFLIVVLIVVVMMKSLNWDEKDKEE